MKKTYLEMICIYQVSIIFGINNLPNNYLKGYFDEVIAIKLLLPQNLKDQYAFKTEKSLSILEFREVKLV